MTKSLCCVPCSATLALALSLALWLSAWLPGWLTDWVDGQGNESKSIATAVRSEHLTPKRVGISMATCHLPPACIAVVHCVACNVGGHAACGMGHRAAGVITVTLRQDNDGRKEWQADAIKAAYDDINYAKQKNNSVADRQIDTTSRYPVAKSTYWPSIEKLCS